MQKSMVLKALILAGVALAMFIALAAIDGLANERKMRAQGVSQDIARSYAGRQRLIGPVATIRWKETWNERRYNRDKDVWYEEELSKTCTYPVFPKSFSYSGEMEVEGRYRGIFKANIFQTEGVLSGNFVFPELEGLGFRDDAEVELVSVEVCMLLSDLRGITRVPDFKWNGESLTMEAGSDLVNFGDGVHASIPDAEHVFGKEFDFEVDLAVHGMGGFSIVPMGDENRIRLSSPWPHPSFTGDFLAADLTVSENGFAAEWNVNGLASSAQQHLSGSGHKAIQDLGVSLIDPVNVYSQTDRALKYGFLFIFITFSGFFLFEAMVALRIHPIQYLFVGLAQAVFFLLLLSLSEHVGFGRSYIGATASTVLLITFYLFHVMKGLGRGLLFGALLTLLYGVLYALLQSEDHALVAGTALVFGLIALVMMLTRKVDWYALGAGERGVVS